jgi:EAL domain-containing protein (putative c-di-GMP-specific phosphodiesterase class I)
MTTSPTGHLAVASVADQHAMTAMTLQAAADQVGEQVAGESIGRVAAALAAHPLFRDLHEVPAYLEWIAREISLGHRPNLDAGRAPSVQGAPHGPNAHVNSTSELEVSEASWDGLLDHVFRTEAVEAFMQPIADLCLQSVVGYQALARFAGPSGLTADRWFVAANARGLRDELEALAIRAAFRRLVEAPRRCYISINVSPQGLASDHVQRALREVRDLRGVAIELTAPAHPDELDDLADRVTTLRHAGANIGITYSIGHTTSRELSVLRPTLLKLTQPSFSTLEGLRAEDAVIVVHKVEQMEDVLALRRAGVRFVQGFVVGVPTTSWQPLAGAMGVSAPQ